MIRFAVFGLVGCLLIACEGVIDTSAPGAPRDQYSPEGVGGPSIPGGPDFGDVAFPGVDGAADSVASPTGPPQELVSMTPEELLDISPEDFSSIPPGTLIKASRDTCTSPCPVFFDAVADLPWSEIESSTFTWVFSNGTTSDGYMAARVFELPEGEGETTFEATLVVEQDGFLVARDTHAVTVRPLEGRTICVAQSDFSACPSSASADHFTDVGDAWDAIETNGRILFRRGDSFPKGVHFGSTVPGPVHVGAFGDTNQPRPSLVQSGGSWDIDTDWSVSDLEISGDGMGTTLVAMFNAHTLLLRSHIHDAASSITFSGNGYDSTTHKFVINNTMTNMYATNYVGGSYIALVGNYIERWESGRHTIRLAGGKYVLVANNAFISDVGHSSLTVRGSHSGNRPGSEHVLVQGNLMMQWASVHPQNASSNEWLRHVIWERNVHIPYDDTGSTQTGLSVNGNDMVIRNNIFRQIRRAITIETHPLAGPSENIHVYQNTQFVDRDRGSSHYFCDAGPGTTGTVLKNNLAALYGDSPTFASVEGGAVMDNNYSYTPARTSACEEPNGSSACTDPRLMNTSDVENPDFMRPEAGSPAIDAAVDAPVSNDFHGVPRPQGGAPDVGAVESPE